MNDIISTIANVVTALVALIGGVWAFHQHIRKNEMVGRPIVHLASVEPPERTGPTKVWLITVVATSTDMTDWYRWNVVWVRSPGQNVELCNVNDAWEYDGAGGATQIAFDKMPFSYQASVAKDFPFAPGTHGQISQQIYLRAPADGYRITLLSVFSSKGTRRQHTVPLEVKLM